jgi:N-formylmaleamate deformylase
MIYGVSTPATESGGRSGYLAREGVRLHYLEYGAGPPLVVVPGITSPAITWEFIARELAVDHRVVILDVRGRGLSDKPQSGFELPDYAADLAALVEQADAAGGAVLGHSMGARTVAAFGVLHPQLRGPLIIVDPPLTGPGRPEYPTSLEAFMEQLEKARAGATAEDMRAYFPTWDEEQLRLRAEWLASCDETAVRETWLNFHREDFFDYLRRLEPPALFMYGGESPAVTADGVEEVREANPRLELACVPRAGHMIPWDNLDGFLAETGRFLSAA